MSSGVRFLACAFTEYQPGFICVAGTVDHSISVQHSLIEYDHLIVGLQVIAERLGEGDLEGTAVTGIRVDGVVLCGNHSACLISSSGNNMTNVRNLVKCKAFGEYIVQNIVLCACVNSDGGAEVYGLTDISGVGAAPVAGRVFLNLLVQSGSTVLGINGSTGVGGSQTTQSTHGGVHQIVAQGQFGESHCATAYGIVSSVCRGSNGDNIVVLGVLQGQLCKSGDGIVILRCIPGHIACVVDRYISKCVCGREEAIPAVGNLVGVYAGGGIVAFQVQNFVDRIGVAFTKAVDGDRSGLVFRVVCDGLLSRNYHCQRQYQCQGHYDCE